MGSGVFWNFLRPQNCYRFWHRWCLYWR